MGSLGKYILLKDTRNPVLRASVGNSLQLWLDANDSSTITESGGKVSQWDDKSGNGNHVTQGVEANQPTTDSVMQNDKNVIDFDGGDTLALPSALFAIPNGDLTIFVVVKQDSTADERILSAGIDSGTKMLLQYASGSVFFYNNDSFDPVPIGIDETNFNIMTCFKSGTTQSISINGGTPVTDSAGTNVSGINGFAIGSNQAGTSNFFNGNAAECIIYNRSLSTSEITDIERYLATKWAIGISAPDNIGGLQLWLDANDGSTITESGGKVSQWDDKSGNGNDAVQGTGVDQPTLVNNQINGKTIIRGNGTSNVLEIPNLGLNGLSSVTMFMVINIDNTTDGFDSLFAFGTGAEGGLHTSSSGFARIVKTQDGLGILANGTAISSGLADSNNIFMLTTDGTTVITEENGVEIVSLAQAGNWATGAGNYAIFASSSPNRWIKIDIAEILIYDRALSVVERGQVETYLSNKYGITLV